MDQLQFLVNGAVYDTAVEGTRNVIGAVLGVIRLGVTGICLIALTILAIQYFMSTPSLKAESKSQLPTYMLGIVLFVGLTYFIPFIVEFLGSIFAQINI